MSIIIRARDACPCFAGLIGQVGNEQRGCHNELFDKPLIWDIPIMTVRRFLKQLRPD